MAVVWYCQVMCVSALLHTWRSCILGLEGAVFGYRQLLLHGISQHLIQQRFPIREAGLQSCAGVVINPSGLCHILLRGAPAVD